MNQPPTLSEETAFAIRSRHVWIAIAVFLFALAARLAPMPYLTYDEGMFWVDRSEGFLNALSTGRLEQTAQAFHPGVGTMWMGAAGIQIDQLANGQNHVQNDNLQYRINARRVMATANALAVSVSFLLLMRFFPAGKIPLVASLLWASEPFAVAHSSILHVDGLSTSLMFLSLLAGLIAFKFDDTPYRYNLRQQVRWRWWVASAILGGMATITKFTTISVVGILWFVAFTVTFRQFRVNRLVRQAAPFVAWIFIALVTGFLLYPAAWAHGSRVLELFNYGVNVAVEGHLSYFLGEVTSYPGPLFYLVAIPLRLTPWALAGLALLVFLRKKTSEQRLLVYSLVMYCVLFTVLMSAQAKQFERYLLPIVPALLVLSAAGLVYGAERVSHWISARASRIKVPQSLVWGLVLAVLGINLAATYPYAFAYFNPILGGAPTAENTILVGWGEGLNEALDYIDGQDTPCDTIILSAYDELMRQYDTCYQFVDFNNWPETIESADFIIDYINHRQRQMGAELLQAIGDRQPVYVVKINGVEFASVYDLSG